jgi:hypothetical protein
MTPTAAIAKLDDMSLPTFRQREPPARNIDVWAWLPCQHVKREAPVKAGCKNVEWDTPSCVRLTKHPTKTLKHKRRRERQTTPTNRLRGCPTSAYEAKLTLNSRQCNENAAIPASVLCTTSVLVN